MDPKVIIVISAVVFFIAVFGFLLRFMMMYNQRVLRLSLEKELLRESFERERLSSELDVKQQTLRMISQELHDNVGQMMSLVNLHINVIDFTDIDDARRRVAELKGLVVRIIQDIRDLSRTLDPDRIAANGFEGIIRQELESIHHAGLLQYHFNVEGVKPSLNPSVEVEVLRILQEALHNVIKHSNASQVLFKVIYSANRVHIIFEDNGVGFNLSEREGGGNGLKNMRNRAKLINADIDLVSAPGSGTRLELSFLIYA